MKKLFSIIGAIVAAAAVFTVIAVILKKIKLSFSVEFADGDNAFDCACEADAQDVSVSIEDEKEDEDIITVSIEEDEGSEEI